MTKAKQTDIEDVTEKAPKEKKAKAPKEGHNSGVNAPLVGIFDEFMDLEEKKKELAKAQRDLHARAKTEFDVQSAVFSHEIRLRKLDRDVRIQFESGHYDLKDMLGYQASLDLAEGTVARTEKEFVDPTHQAKMLARHG